jgi:primosomal protein N'
MEAPMARIAGQWRFVVELVGPRAGSVQRVLGMARAAGMLKSDAHTAVDVDPVSLM